MKIRWNTFKSWALALAILYAVVRMFLWNWTQADVTPIAFGMLFIWALAVFVGLVLIESVVRGVIAIPWAKFPRLQWNNPRKIIVAVTLLLLALAWIDKLNTGDWDTLTTRFQAIPMVAAVAFYIAGLRRKE